MTTFRSMRTGLAGLVLLIFCAIAPQVMAEGNVAGPFGVEIFVRGSFNGWDIDNPMKFDRNSNAYVGNVELAPGYYEFKIASVDWSTVDLGYDEHTADGIVEVGVPEPIETAGYHNMMLSLAEGGVYSFRLDTSDLNHLTVLVTYAHPGGDVLNYNAFYPGSSWYFSCLNGGLGDLVTGDLHVHGAFNVNDTGSGAYHIIDQWQIDGVAYDSSGTAYGINGAVPFELTAPKGGGFVQTWIYRQKMVSHGETPNLLLKITYRLTVNAKGEVAREFYFEQAGCSK